MDKGRPCGVLCRIAAALAEIFSQTQEEPLSLRPGEVAKRANVPHQIVGEVFKALAERGYMECVRTARGLTCAVPPGSPLRSASREEVYRLLEAL
jgi:sugar-specific transcriptional regulator TrmB